MLEIMVYLGNLLTAGLQGLTFGIGAIIAAKLLGVL